MADNKINVPDIGGATDVDVIEVLVKKGDKIEKDTSLITLESDKASMEIPSPKAGTVKSVGVSVGDQVSEGDLILILSDEQPGEEESSDNSKNESKKESEHKEKDSETTANEDDKSSAMGQKETKEIKIPDIGGASGVEVIEVLVKKGDEISKDTSIITLESEKASMEIPSPHSGQVKSIKISVGDKVSEGDLILCLESDGGESEQTTPKHEKAENHEDTKEITDDVKAQKQHSTKSVDEEKFSSEPSVGSDVYAGPAVRRIAREFGVNLEEVRGSGRKSRLTKEDVQQFVKNRLQEKSTPGLSVAPAPSIDFSKFGDVETKPLNKIKRLTGEHVHRAWVTIPHVTQFDEADITALEAFRKREADNAKKEGYKLTLLAFVCKAVSKALTAYPHFNASLDPSGDKLIYKKYFNIGVAVDTPNGLVVPVIKEVNRLSVSDIAKEMARLSDKARNKGLTPADMSGGCFTISSLGGIGGTAFTPIVNSPEVAILGLSRSIMKPVYINEKFEPRLMLPLSLSYDHRVIDGADAARFTRALSDFLSDIRKILL